MGPVSRHVEGSRREWQLPGRGAGWETSLVSSYPFLQDFKESFALNINKLAQEKAEAIYATVQKKKKLVG